MTSEQVNGDLPTRDLPTSWIWVAIGEITESVDKVRPDQDFPEEEFIYLDISSIDNDLQKVTEPKTYLGKDAPSRARQLVYAGDVLYSTVRTYLKNIAMVPDIYDGQVASTGFSVLRGKGDISSKYIFYYTLTNEFLTAMEAKQRGTSYPAVRDSDVREYVIPLAPVAEQQRIVNKIEALFSRLDAGVEALHRLQRNLQRYKTAVLKAASEGRLVPQDPADEPASDLLQRILAEHRTQWAEEKLTEYEAKDKKPSTYSKSEPPELPQSWIWVPIGEITEPIDKVRPDQDFPEEEFVYLDISSIDNDLQKVTEPKTYLGKDAPSRARQLVYAGDVLYSTVRTYLKNIAMVPDVYDGQVASTGFSVLRSKGDISSKYIFYYTLTNEFLTAMEAKQRGTSYPAVRDSDVREHLIPLPPLAEQHRIVDEIDRLMSVVNDAVKICLACTKRSIKLRQAILKHAFEGKLASQNPEDEPASELLARVGGSNGPKQKKLF